MADETATATAAAEPTEPVTETPEASAPDGPTPEQIAAEAREAAARSEGEARALREVLQRQPAPAAEKSEPIYTPRQIEAARAAGQIDAARAGLEYERYIAASQRQAADEARAAAQAEARVERITEQMEPILAARPHLRTDPNHPETLAAIRWITARGGNPADQAQQLMALQALYGNGGGAVTTGNEARRTKVLGTGVGQPAAGPIVGKADPLKGIPADYIAAWRRTGAQLDDPKVAQKHADRSWSSRHRAGQARPA
jgi:hypothetical protein